MAKIFSRIKGGFCAVGRWIKNHAPTRRRIIQLYAALLTNANIKGFVSGRIYTGDTKNICAPGLNCYSCPGAVAACPLGALQNSLGSSGTTTPYYILGIIALLGLSLARTICGFLCPFGLAQELVYKAKTPKLKKSRYTRLLSYLKYVLLVALVIAVPLIYHNVPAFCKYICPAGTFEGAGGLLSNGANADYYSMLGYLFSWKAVLLVCCVVACVFIYRAFCRFICPLGAIYGFFNKISLLGVKLEKSKCIDCGACVATCKMDIRHVGDHECINCGECIPVCPTKAISWKGSKIVLQVASFNISGIPSEQKADISAILSSGTSKVAAPANSVQSSISEGGIEVESAPDTPEVVTADTAQSAPKESGIEAETHSDNLAKQTQGESELQAAIKKVKRRGLIMEIAAWVLAAAVLITALVYYNAIAPSPVTQNVTLPQFTLAAYDTAYSGETFSYPDDIDPDKPLVMAFWSTRNENSAQYITSFAESAEKLKDSANFIAVHVSNSDDSATVQAKIAENGWQNLAIPILQDTAELDLYSKSEGGGAFPTTVFVTIHGEIKVKSEKPLTQEEISGHIDDTVYSTIYREGDKMPVIKNIKTYESAFKGQTYSTDEALGKVLVINFWYVSCGPCVEELPYFNEVQKEFGDSIVTLAIHSDNGEQPQPFIDKVDKDHNKESWSDYSIIFGQDKRSENFKKDGYIYGILGGTGPYPMTVIVNAEGYITKVMLSSAINSNKDDLRPAILKALAG